MKKFGFEKSINNDYFGKIEWKDASLPLRNLAEMLVKSGRANRILFGVDYLHSGNKPFNILNVAVTKDGVVVTVSGTKTPKIETRWTERLTKACGQPITIVWV